MSVAAVEESLLLTKLKLHVKHRKHGGGRNERQAKAIAATASRCEEVREKRWQRVKSAKQGRSGYFLVLIGGGGNEKVSEQQHKSKSIRMRTASLPTVVPRRVSPTWPGIGRTLQLVASHGDLRNESESYPGYESLRLILTNCDLFVTYL